MHHDGQGCLVRWSRRQAVVVLPERVGGPNAGLVAGQLLAVLGRGAVLVIVDMTATRACDDAGALALARACRRAAARGTEVRLVIPAAAVRRAAARSGLDRLAPVFPALAAARAAQPPVAVVLPLRPRAAGGGPGVPGEDPRPVPGAAGGGGAGAGQGVRLAGLEDALTQVTGGIFRAGLTLQAGLGQGAGGLRDAAEHALDLLDDTVREARDAAFAAAWPARGAGIAPGPAAGAGPGGAARGAADVRAAAAVRAEAAALRESAAAAREQSRAARARAAQLYALSAAAHDQVAVTLGQLAARCPGVHPAGRREPGRAAAGHASRLRQRAGDGARAGAPRPPGARAAPGGRPGLPAGGRPGDGTVRRAVAFIDERAGQDITVADIARAAQVSARAVQLAFRRHLGTTPLDYLRQVRLRGAHQDLLDAPGPARGTVTAIAARWQFASSSRFSAYYRARYGVLPSHTLRHGETASPPATTSLTAVPS